MHLIITCILSIVICQGQGCGYRQICIAVGGKAKCKCPTYICTWKNNPVCGNNGKTYGSVCSLELEECSNNTFIGIRQTGECPQGKARGNMYVFDKCL